MLGGGFALLLLLVLLLIDGRCLPISFVGVHGNSGHPACLPVPVLRSSSSRGLASRLSSFRGVARLLDLLAKTFLG